MGELNFESIFDAKDIDNLFEDPEVTSSDTTEDSEQVDNASSKGEEKDDKTTGVTPNDLFDDSKEDGKPESVGSEEDTEGKGDSSTDDGGGTSPNENFYSSIANAMAEDGIFPNLDEDAISKVVDAETLREAIEAEVNARFDEGHKRVLEALDNGVEPTEIKQYEGALNFIYSIKEADLNAEDDKGENLRTRLIYQDFLNRGMDPEKAQKLTQRSVEAGTDIEDAKEALAANKDFFETEYRKLLDKAKEEAQAAKEAKKKAADKLKDSILKDETAMGGLNISMDNRKRAYDNLVKPVYRDPETGSYLTAIQKYETENRSDFLKYVGLFFTLTNGFKDFKSFMKGEIKKENKKGLRELEQKLQNTRRNSDGSLKLVTTQKEDPESFIGSFDLDI